MKPLPLLLPDIKIHPLGILTCRSYPSLNQKAHEVLWGLQRKYPSLGSIGQKYISPPSPDLTSVLCEGRKRVYLLVSFCSSRCVLNYILEPFKLMKRCRRRNTFISATRTKVKALVVRTKKATQTARIASGLRARATT